MKLTAFLLPLLLLTPVVGIDPIFPAALKLGDTIQFIAPAGPLDQAKMELAKGRLEELGFVVRVPDDLYRKTGYLAGTDDRRLEELEDAFRDPDVDAVFPGTGGYGTTRFLDRIDYDLIRKNPKILVGFSDITALHLAINQRTGLVTFHTPSPMWGLGNEGNLSPFSAHWFWRAILADRFPKSAEPGYIISALHWQQPPYSTKVLEDVCELDLPITVHGGKGRGRLTGGNLSLVAALMGTPFEIDTEDKILFLEDVGEAPYRVDRMLCTMRLAGKLATLKGVILGQFTRRKSEDTSDEVTTVDDVLDHYFDDLKIPVLRNFPIGHHRCNATFPIGVECELDGDAKTLTLLENPVKTQ